MPDAIDRLSVADMTPECVTGVRGIGYEPAALDDAHDHRHEAGLRVNGMHFNEFCHARIVGERRLRAYPCNTL
jgi:hypothetical protein